MESAYLKAAALLPEPWRQAAYALPLGEQLRAEELRLRLGKSAAVLLPGGERPLPASIPVTAGALRDLLERATGASVHAAADELRQGYVTARGGCRIGFCGQTVVENGVFRTLRAVSSAAIRIPREKHGCADGLFPALYGENRFASTLLLSPPGGGKTTLARELVRLLSLSGRRVAVLDERGELGGGSEGRTEFDLGPQTDVLTGAPKAEGAMLLLRAMDPEILAMDEITAKSDLEAVALAVGCGVQLLATAHAENTAALRQRPLYRELLALGAFDKAVVIHKAADGTRLLRVEALT